MNDPCVPFTAFQSGSLFSFFVDDIPLSGLPSAIKDESVLKFRRREAGEISEPALSMAIGSEVQQRQPDDEPSQGDAESIVFR